MTSVIPSATISTGMFAISTSRWFSRVKKPGASRATTIHSVTMAIATEISRRWRWAMLGNLAATWGRFPTCQIRTSGQVGNLPHVTLQSQGENLLWRGLFPGERVADGAGMHDRDTVAHPQDLRQLRRNHQDRPAALPPFDPQLLDFPFRSDVHALRGFVQDQ